MLQEIRKVIVNNKELHIVGLHNQALEAWEACDRCNVFSLDYHTDTRQAFETYSYWRADSEINAGLCPDQEIRKKELTDQKIRDYLERRITLDQVNDNLKHDEHLDFAVRTGLINRAFILSTNSNEESTNPNVHIALSPHDYNGEPLIEYSPPCIPFCHRDVHGRDCSELRADSVIENHFLDRAIHYAEQLTPFFFDNFILDIDCDFFNTEKSLFPDDISTFQTLIKKSRLITIALEPECVKICRRDGHVLNSDIILTRLLSIIEAA